MIIVVEFLLERETFQTKLWRS